MNIKVGTYDMIHKHIYQQHVIAFVCLELGTKNQACKYLKFFLWILQLMYAVYSCFIELKFFKTQLFSNKHMFNSLNHIIYHEISYMSLTLHTLNTFAHYGYFSLYIP